MEILFCDICNESVPAPDLTSGKAFRRGGRVVCAACDTAMSLHRGEATAAPGGEPDAARAPGVPAPGRPERADRPEGTGAPAAPRSGGGGAMGALVGLVAVIFAAVGFSLLLERLDEMEGDARLAREVLRHDLGQLRRQQDQLLGALDLRIEESEARADEARKALLADVAALGETLRGELSGHGERTEAVARDLQALGESLDQRDQASADALADLGRQVIDLENDIRFYSDRVVELEETLRLLASRPVAISGGPSGAGAGAGGADTAPPWQGLVTDLAHANPGIRLDAVYALGETRDQRVVPHLVPMLDDDDLFVRMATARVLMDLDARLAVPNLIDTLEDTSSAVREAAMVALRQITSQDFGFEPLASDPERAKRVKAWREWWKKSGDDFLTSS